MQNNKRSGFTLVELLIVIVVIGVLSAMMMLSSTEAVSSAKAAKIINDLTILKKAITSWYVDNHEKVAKNSKGDYIVKVGKNEYYLGVFTKDHNGEKEFMKYIGSNNSTKLTKDNFTNAGEFLLATEKNQWYIGYDLGSDTSLKEKIASRAKSLRLLGATKKLKENGDVDTDTAEIHPYDAAKDQKVYMLILQF